MKPLLDESPSLLSPVADFRLLKSEQYSTLFETACEIEYYACHKNLPESRRTSCRQRAITQRQASGKSQSASSSPAHNSEAVGRPHQSPPHTKQPVSENKTSTVVDGDASADVWKPSEKQSPCSLPVQSEGTHVIETTC